jgi:curved DNA-binding protein CbpA
MPAREGEIQNIAHAYRVLDVPHDASSRAIKSSYRKLVKRWHPDRYRPGSEQHAEATQMTSLVNAAYSRIQDAPLRAGFATPFSTPRNKTAGTSTDGETASASADPGWSRVEYVPSDPPVTDASFLRIASDAASAGAREDASRGIDWIGVAVRFVCGAFLGGLFGFGGEIRRATATKASFIVATLLGALIGGLLSAFGGDRFWRSIRPLGPWYWGRWR